MISVDEISADDLRNLPSERSLPWEECRDGVTVIIEPRPHWASDMRALKLTTRKYCHYRDWTRADRAPGSSIISIARTTT